MERCGPGVEVDLAEGAAPAALFVADDVLSDPDRARELERVGQAFCNPLELLSVGRGSVRGAFDPKSAGERRWRAYSAVWSDTHRSAGERTCESDQSLGWCRDAKPEVRRLRTWFSVVVEWK